MYIEEENYYLHLLTSMVTQNYELLTIAVASSLYPRCGLSVAMAARKRQRGFCASYIVSKELFYFFRIVRMQWFGNAEIHQLKRNQA